MYVLKLVLSPRKPENPARANLAQFLCELNGILKWPSHIKCFYLPASHTVHLFISTMSGYDDNYDSDGGADQNDNAESQSGYNDSDTQNQDGDNDVGAYSGEQDTGGDDSGYDASGGWNQNDGDSNVETAEGDEPAQEADGGEQDNGGTDYDPPSWNQNDDNNSNVEPADAEVRVILQTTHTTHLQTRERAKRRTTTKETWPSMSPTSISPWIPAMTLATKRTSGPCWSSRLCMSESGMRTRGTDMHTRGSRRRTHESRTPMRGRRRATRESVH
ncbi:hypothetical protein B0H13DRAFT_767802 [Mycena leptocephala]|nr:hypothetical protein B0H13DRAFT_767802 [Mycena leptocephala]